MATATTQQREVTYNLTLSEEEASMLITLLGQTNSVYENVSDEIYNALLHAGVPEFQWTLYTGDKKSPTLTLKRKEDS